MVRPGPEALRSFVRHSLGCGCPDDVLQDITYATTPGLTGLGMGRINVGGRLLVHVLAVTDEKDLQEVGATLAAGIAERDRGGFNRYRLVLAVQGRALFHAAAGAATGAAAGNPAERAHVHVVPREQVPFL